MDELELYARIGLHPNEHKFKEAAELYVAQITDDVIAGRRKAWQSVSYVRPVQRFLVPYFGEKNIQTVNQRDMLGYSAWRRDYYKKHGTNIEYERNGRRIKSRQSLIRSETGATIQSELTHISRIRAATSMRLPIRGQPADAARAVALAGSCLSLP